MLDRFEVAELLDDTLKLEDYLAIEGNSIITEFSYCYKNSTCSEYEILVLKDNIPVILKENFDDLAYDLSEVHSVVPDAQNEANNSWIIPNLLTYNIDNKPSFINLIIYENQLSIDVVKDIQDDLSKIPQYYTSKPSMNDLLFQNGLVRSGFVRV